MGIENSLTRVTGTNASNIQGALGVTGSNANLILINPNGILFGPTASLSLNGSLTKVARVKAGKILWVSLETF